MFDVPGGTFEVKEKQYILSKYFFTEGTLSNKDL